MGDTSEREEMGEKGEGRGHLKSMTGAYVGPKRDGTSEGREEKMG